MRTCTRCQSIKELGQFRRNPRMTSGYDSWCKVRRAWALPNLRPLWAADNIRKGARREVLL